jgi:hypothetical protein
MKLLLLVFYFPFLLFVGLLIAFTVLKLWFVWL